jgi:hypothetical protein
MFRIRVIANPGGRGEYFALGSPRKIKIGTDGKGIPVFKFEAYLAKRVLTGENIYLARCLAFSDKGNPSMRMYSFANGSSKKLFGFIQPPQGHLSRRVLGRDMLQLYADQEMGNNLIFGSKYRQAIVPGDFMIVRLQGTSRDGRITFVEPVTNIMPEDVAFSPDGKPIHTIVEGYRPGDLIHNLPITGSRPKGPDSKQFVGLAHIKRPKGELGFFYTHVAVNGAAGDKGKVVSLACIIRNSEKGIIAKKLE